MTGILTGDYILKINYLGYKAKEVEFKLTKKDPDINLKEIKLEVSKSFRSGVSKSHTAAHIVHTALRNILGDHVAQAGSNVTPGKFRFDFSHTDKVTAQELDEIFNETGFNSENLSIRETNRLATIINEKHEIDFVRMEMGIPNIPTPDIAKNAEKEAIDRGLQGFYPPFDGIPELKEAGRKFVKAFLDLDVKNKHIIPTCGSLQGGYISQALAGNMNKGKRTILYLSLIHI